MSETELRNRVHYALFSISGPLLRTLPTALLAGIASIASAS
jgi:hypothetical protein